MVAPRFANYDLEYSWKDYPAEVATVTQLVRQRNPEATSLLDVACGTGRHLELLCKEFSDAAGIDLSEMLLSVARARLPDIPLHRGDMADFDLGRRFDAVTCLFSSVGYLDGPEELESAVACMSAHLNPCGVLIIEPWLSPDGFDPNHLHSLYVKDETTHLARMSQARVEGRHSVIKFFYQWLDSDGVHRAEFEHRLFLFRREEYLGAIASAGLSPEWIHDGLMPGRGLALGVKSP